jgi:Zn-dependent peptidase ImmA (M78 family)
MDRKGIARTATAAALRMRRSAGCGLEGAICVYDLAQRLGIEVRFLDIPSMEGMYYRVLEPTIILSSLRPPGRRAFTCAHELGHHSRGDRTHVDQAVEQWQRANFEPREFAADCFAGTLLMPKMAVERAFALREWKVSECSPGQVYTISNYFGVGYTTLIHHMRSALLLLPSTHAQALLKVKPRHAQALALGWEAPEAVWIVDSYWTDRAIDVEVGDLIFVSGQPSSEGECAELVLKRKEGRLFRARQPGIGRLEVGSGWSAFVRVSRRGFVGRSLYRHWEEVDDE